MKVLRPVQCAPDLMHAIYNAIHGGNKFTAIKLMQARTGIKLMEAKDLVDGIHTGLVDPASPLQVSQQVFSVIIGCLTGNAKIPAIRELRIETGIGLREAEDTVDLYAQVIDQMTPTAEPLPDKPNEIIMSASNATQTIEHPTALSDEPLTILATSNSTSSEQPTRQDEIPFPIPNLDLTANPIQQFAHELRRAHRWAGEPPYRTLAERTYKTKHLPVTCSTATISRAFSGADFPRWEVVVALLTVFGVPKVQIMTAWRSLWVAVREQRDPIAMKIPTGTIPVPADTHTPAVLPDGHECEACGAWVVNADRHGAWHWEMESRAQRTTMRAIDGTGTSPR